MARSMNITQAEFYRALIEELRDGEWVAVHAYGPYHNKAQARDRDARWSYAQQGYKNGTRRMRQQKQDVDALTLEIRWRDIEFDD